MRSDFVGCVESAKTHRRATQRAVRPRRLDAPYTYTYAPRIEPLEDRTLMSTCHVTRLSDTGTGKGFRGDLRYCINKVNDNPGPDTIDFNVVGTINLTGALPDLASEINIHGPGSELLNVRRNSGGYYRIFTVTSSAVVSMADLTVSNGYLHTSSSDVYGGGILNAGTLVLNRVAVTENLAFSITGNGYGGGIHSTGDLTVIDSTLSNNTVQGWAAWGGGLHSTGATSIYSSTISENIAGVSYAEFGSGGAFFLARTPA